MTTFRDTLSGRIAALLLIAILAIAFVLPVSALAREEYTNGAGVVEGDPGDGLGASGGGSGSSGDIVELDQSQVRFDVGSIFTDFQFILPWSDALRLDLVRVDRLNQFVESDGLLLDLDGGQK